MKQFTLSGYLFYSIMFLLASCAGSESEKKSSTDSTTTDSSIALVGPKNTTITTPQNVMVVKHKVANYNKWKSAYDAYDSVLLVHGIHSYLIGRGLLDSNMVLVTMKIDELAKAKAFAKDPGLKKAWQKGGAIGKFTFTFVTMTFQDTELVASDIRSRTTFTVKDWSAWQKSFEEGKQERLDFGLAVRSYGHDPDDDKKVVLITVVLDTAKAFAYYKSDLLKKRRAMDGVIGEPERFLYRGVLIPLWFKKI